MTNEETVPPQIYVPCLHRELLLFPLPREVSFLDPGLPQTASGSGFFHPAAYPFPPETAAKMLTELLSLGEFLGVTATEGRSAANAKNGGRSALNNAEKAALAHFAGRGNAQNFSGGPENGNAEAIAAQKILLLSWDLEERLIAINNLRAEVSSALEPLQKSLRDPLTSKEGLPVLPPDDFSAVLEKLPDIAKPDWRICLAAMAAFIPPNAILVTGDEAIRAALDEENCLHPLPRETGKKLQGWTEDEKAACLRAKEPLKRILGQHGKMKQSPCILNATEIIVLPAGGKV
ncbi:hypothetical protein FACS1894206_07610 [Deltaproteobacteria bacterium]|nr:hypothetical protein FACS1894206_07610 [Deltaproteobacteria bacterium]